MSRNRKGLATADPLVGNRKRNSWWVVAGTMILVGVVGIIFALNRPTVGPTLPKPIGNTSLQSFPIDQEVTWPSATAKAPVANTTFGAYVNAVASTTPATPRLTSLVAQVIPLKARSRPIRIRIPSIGVSAPVSVLGLNRDGSVAVPTDFYIPGWYKFGPAPGQKGSAVILGHVDSYKGPAVFYRIRDLKIGNQVIVTLANHTTVRFAVIGVHEYSKSNFPERLVFGPRNYSALQLVTCGGVFNAATGHYESNIVAFTSLVSKGVPRGHKN